MTDPTLRARAASQQERSAAASAFLDEVAATPGRPMIANIAGSRGSGKSALLDDVEVEYRSQGMRVGRGPAHLDFDGRPGVVLVDDAHLLRERELQELVRFVKSGRGGLVITHRMGPLSPGLQTLVATIEHYHQPVILGVFSREDIAVRLASGSGRAAPAALVEQLEDLTGGTPWIIDRVLEALPAGRLTASIELVSQIVIEQVGQQIERLDPDLRRLVLAIAVGYDLSTHLPPGLETAGERIHELIEEARAAGLLVPGGELIPIVRMSVLRTVPKYQVRAAQRGLVDAITADGGSLDAVARSLSRDGFRDARIAEELERAAGESLLVNPALSFALYQDALAAGSDPVSIAARRAQAAFSMGDIDGAGRILDDLLSRDDVPDRSRALTIAAAVWAHRGMLMRSAELYAWSGEDAEDAVSSMATIARIGTGDPAALEAVVPSQRAKAMPTAVTLSLALMAEGLRASVRPSPSEALTALVRASDMMNSSGISVPLPDSAAALAAVIALQNGELAVAESVLEAGVRSAQGGPAARPRLLLLQAWTAMQRDQLDTSRAFIATASTFPLCPRDQLLLAALEVGVARRVDDATGLLEAWMKARDTLLHVPVDLYSLLPLGELVIAGARLRESQRLSAHLADAWNLLHRLGDPPLWSIRLHWSAMQAALLTEAPEEFAPHAAALVTASKDHALAGVLAAAGWQWVAVLSGQFESHAVELAARQLASVGLTWDGSRLAGHGAARAADRREMGQLLACARDLHPAASRAATHHAGAADTAPGAAVMSGAPALSAREREVARLVLEGKTYREIGEAIFVSPRTAEHHMARIRDRLGATTRSDLLARLRRLLAETDMEASR